MMTIIAASAIKELRHLIASIISDEKSYNVPAVCVRYGMAEGTGDEAFRGKYRYVLSRAQALTPEKLVQVAKALHAETPNFSLGEALAAIEEEGTEGISELTRRRIVDALQVRSLSARISQLEFLSKLWPISTMRPPDGSRNVADSMEQYINYELFLASDDENAADKPILEALGIYRVSQSQFFKFLEALTDPLARDIPEQSALVHELNTLLAPDRFRLKEVGRVSGAPRYRVQPLNADSTPADSDITKTLAGFSVPDIHERWDKALQRRATDPAAAITSARTLLEDTCKWILHEADATYNDDDDLPVLYKKLAKILKLAPDDYTEQIFKQILGGCASVVSAIGSVRNKLSDAHGQGPLRARPLPRHAELVVNLAGNMATFLIATWDARQAAETVHKTVAS